MRNRLRHCLRIGSGDPIEELASTRIFLEIHMGEGDAAGVFHDERLGGHLDAQRQSVGRWLFFSTRTQ